ncbi:hypothetical protein JHN57_17880 [Streptomyces sp. MBT59]|nr:hypothetical protein [Streptomyces sp. MBT59]MBK6030413.1 hypothetical protein [Streptomyces sp. MBT59]
MARVPAAAVAASGLVGGYGVARWTRKRPLGGVAGGGTPAARGPACRFHSYAASDPAAASATPPSGRFLVHRATPYPPTSPLAAAGSLAAYEWNRQAGPRAAAGLSVAYVAAFAGSHPLAKKVGAWPAVFAVAGGVAAASWAVTRRAARS